MNKYKDVIKRYLKFFLLGPVFIVIEACGEFILPFLNANIIDIGAANGDVPYIIENGAYMFLIAIGMLITGISAAYFAVNGASYLAADVRKKTFDRIQQFSFANIDEFSTGSLITRITNDVTQIQTFTQTLLRGAFRSPVMLIGAIVMSFLLNVRLAIVLCIVVPILSAAIICIIRFASPRYTIMQKSLDELNSDIDETITNERVIKSFVRENFERKKFENVNNDLMSKSTKALSIMIFLQPISTLAINVTTLFVVWIAGHQIMIGNMSIGVLTAFITYLSQVLTALTFLANTFLQGTRAAVSNKRIEAVLDASIDLTDNAASSKEIVVTSGKIEYRNVSFRFFKNNCENVIKNINLKISHGKRIGIIGSTGSGKTTLVSMIPRLYDVDTGEVCVDGINVKELSLQHLRECVAIVLQKNVLFSGSIAENLRWGNENATDDELMCACKIAMADSFINSFPDGYETVLEQGGSNLSGGQKQRICIARALLKKPKILILDDSTSAVDTATDAGIRAGIAKECSDMTILIIAQRISSVIDADSIIVMEDGEIVGFGSNEELIKNCPTYQEIYYSQIDKEAEING